MRRMRRRLSEAGAAVSDEALSRRAYLEAEALAVEGMERTRALGEELLQAKALIAQLRAEVCIKDVIIQSKDDQLQQAKDAQLRLHEVLPLDDVANGPGPHVVRRRRRGRVAVEPARSLRKRLPAG